MYESRVRLTHIPSGRVVMVSGEWRAPLHRMRDGAMRMLASQLWRDAHEPADMAREVAAYVLPGDMDSPHDLAPYRIGPAIGAAEAKPKEAAQRGEGSNL